LYHPNENDEILCYGTSLGYTVFWGKKPGGKGPDAFCEMYMQRCAEKEIMCMMTRSSSADDTHLVVGTRDLIIQIWKVGSVVENAFSVKLPKTVSKWELEDDEDGRSGNRGCSKKNITLL
jgi:hypothetical protein